MPDISLYNTFEILTVPGLASSQKQLIFDDQCYNKTFAFI